ncbi:DUF1488 domain-containing protein [Vibrio genomosp. F6]|uniref:Transcriptional regulator n=1 Tax=Vibrio genomosp. F6 str. FF-238 TaxID=1191298 RepID=A0A1E5D1X0_9VIBR|nr:DUF1488 domain-containing protein [Vibrio genomosp. F6]OEE77434.1 transcriptional regulator [Vibrio genomosp. F6 str. FF-238]
MNQSILFADIQEWDQHKCVVTFPAQQAGALIECSISLEMIERLSGISIDGEQQALQVFSSIRFDVEELAEELIENEEFNERGEIELR